MIWQLGYQVLAHSGGGATDSLAMVAKARSEAAADVLADIGVRFNDRGSFVPKGDELEALRQTFDLCRGLLAVMPTGMVSTAIDNAHEMVDEFFRKHDRMQLAA